MKIEVDHDEVTLRSRGNYDGIARLKMLPELIMELSTYAFINSKVEVRLKDRCVSIFVYEYSDSELPDWWRDSEILWSNKN